jgi:thioredoxin 2
MTSDDRTHVGCAHCGATNRIPTARLRDDPVCGQCGASLLTGQPVELTDASFDRFARASDLPLIVDFWAPWCGPCRSMAPHFERAAAQLKGRAIFVKVNSDDNPQVATRYGIRSIPTLVKLQQGRELDRSSGGRPAEQIAAWATA